MHVVGGDNRRESMMDTRVRLTFLMVVATCTLPARSLAQSVDQVATAPPNIVPANYDSVPVGPFGGLEGSAYAARVGDPSAAWFNPAGLTRQSTAQISGSAGVYQHTSVSPQALPNRGGSAQQLPNFVGLSVPIHGGLTAGVALVTTNAWSQETDAELITSSPASQARFAYSADSEYSRRVAAIGVGYHGSGAWRVGGGFAFSLMDLRLVQSASDRVADGSGLRTLLVTARATGSAVQLRTQAGVQYDTPRFRFGAAVRSPGLTMLGSGVVTLDGTLNAGASSLGASVFDPDARLEYHVPWEIHGGAAYVHDRVELELDVQGYTSIAAYSLLSTVQPTLIYASAGAGTPPTVLSRPFGGLVSASEGVVNAAFGGHVRVMSSRDVRVHGGFATSRSPVGAADQLFNKIDLSSWTVGVSGTWAKFQFSGGFNHRAGTANDVLRRNLLNGNPLQTDIDVRVTGFIYSIAYLF